jgi:hypothetical protein
MKKIINRLNNDKKLKKGKTSKKNAIEPIVERLKKQDAKKERDARRKKVRFMKRKNVSVLENEFEDELKKKKIE